MNPLALGGGLDLTTPAPLSRPGLLRDCLNYETATRDGYTRILGVERFDGGPGVSQYKLAEMSLSSPTGTYAIGEHVSYAGHGGYIIDTTVRAGLTYITVVFAGGTYDLEQGATLTGTDSGAHGSVLSVRIVFTPRGEQSVLQESLRQLASTRRAQVKPVPGRLEADVLATFMLRGTVYAVRDLPRVYFEGGYYTDANEGQYITIEALQYQILDVRVTGDRIGYVIYDPVPGSGPAATPIGSPTLSSLPVSGSIDEGFRTIPFTDGLSVSGGLPPYTWTLAEEDTGPPPPPEVGDLSEVRFLSEQSPAALWRAQAAGGWARVPGGRELAFTDGGYLAEISTRALNIDESDIKDTGWTAPSVATINGTNAPEAIDDGPTDPGDMGNASGSTLLATGFGFADLVPAGAKILGIELQLRRWSATTGFMQDLAATLVGIVGQPDNKSHGAIPGGGGSVTTTYGGDSDVWGLENITREDIANPTFGITWSVKRNDPSAGNATRVKGVRVRIHYAERGGTPAYVWDGATDVPIIINLSLPNSGAADDDSLSGVLHIDAAVNANKPRLVQAGEQIRTAAGGGGDLIAIAASRDRPVFLPGQLEVDHNRSRYQTIQTNFYGQDRFDSVWGVSGAGPAFGFDGVNVIKVRSPLSPSDDVPRHIARHGDSLALGFFGGALLTTAIGNPYEVRGEKGATAIEVGDRIMALTPMSGDALGILCQSQSVLLRGLTQLSYYKSTLSAKRGAIEYTAADMGQVIVADSFGLFLADAPESYAAANRNYLSTNVESWLRERLQATLNTEQRFLRPVAALAVRAKNQYRLFFRDGYILTMTQKESPEFTLQRYYVPSGSEFRADTPWTVRALSSAIDSSGRERLFCSYTGVKGGYVFEIEGGNTFDGSAIPHFIELTPVTPEGGSRITRFDRIFVYGTGCGYAPVSLRRAVDYGATKEGPTADTLLGRHDAAASIREHPIKGSIDFPVEGEELSLRFLGVSGEDAPHTLQYLEMYTDARGPSRGDRGD